MKRAEPPRRRRTATALFGCAIGLVSASPVGAQAEPPESDVTLQVRGRLFLDGVRREIDGGGAASVREEGRIRQARLTIVGGIGSKVEAVAEVDFGRGDTVVEDLFVTYRPARSLAFSVGNLKTLGLEQLTSDTTTTFMERGPFADLTDTGRVVAAAVTATGEAWLVTGAVSGGSIDDSAFGDDAPRSVQVRGVWTPVSRDGAVLHLGTWARRRDRDEAVGYGVRPNTDIGDEAVATAAIGRRDETFAVEAAVVRGAVSFQGEYAVVTPAGPGSTVELTAGYAFVSWFATGESRAYDAEAGAFETVEIARAVSEGGPGAIELALRLDHADLGDARAGGLASPRAGVQRSLTLGINWHPVEDVRLLANFTASRTDVADAAFEADVDALQVRAQFEF